MKIKCKCRIIAIIRHEMPKAPLRKDCQNGTLPMRDFSVANVSQRVSASQAACLVGLAKRGFAITSYETMLSDGLDYFYRSDWNEPILSDYSVVLTGDDVYMGMAVEADDGNVVYGWLKFDPVWDGDVNCAWDIDGGAMIVGGGAIPEPSSGVLLLMEMGFLGLRRVGGERNGV